MLRKGFSDKITKENKSVYTLIGAAACYNAEQLFLTRAKSRFKNMFNQFVYMFY